MIQSKIVFGFLLLFSFAVCVSAQDKGALNEVQIDRFLNRANFDQYQFLVSAKDNVKALLSDDCETGSCRYDDEWMMRFVYLNEVIERTVGITPASITYSKPEFRGKLIGIDFSPSKRNVLRDDYVFPADFDCRENAGMEFNCRGKGKSDGVFVKYNYKKGKTERYFKRKLFISG
jgi:hypothetical protein